MNDIFHVINNATYYYFVCFCFKNLACAPPTVLYNGHCYNTCPYRTYVFENISNSDKVKDDILNSNHNSYQPTNSIDEDELQSIDRKKRNKFLKKDQISEDDLLIKALKLLSCEPCDNSCFRCFGPLHSQCSSCSIGSQLKVIPYTNESYCINFSERSSGNALTKDSNHMFRVNIFWIVSLAVFVLIIFLLLFTAFRKNYISYCLRKQHQSDSTTAYSYDRVALFVDDD